MNQATTTIEPRKRPSQARSAATVDAILDAAARILGSEGLVGLNTNAVAQVAGVSVGSLYQYFPGKEAILSELLRRKRAMVLAGINAALEGMEHTSEAQMIERLVRAGIRNQASTPKLLQAYDYAGAVLPMHSETRRINGEIAAAIARFLALHGTPRAETLAQDFIGITRGIVTQALLAGPIDKDELADRVCVAITGYLDAWRRLHGGRTNENGGPKPAMSQHR